jgi:hypothetical protein
MVTFRKFCNRILLAGCRFEMFFGLNYSLNAMLMNWLTCLFKQTQFTCEAAGIVFTNGTHILAGYQPRKKNPHISGLGGSKQKDESYMQTAWRETLEELFELKDILFLVLIF